MKLPKWNNLRTGVHTASLTNACHCYKFASLYKLHNPPSPSHFAPSQLTANRVNSVPFRRLLVELSGTCGCL